MRDSSSRLIFLSYRREDTTSYADMLESELKRLPNASIFIDRGSIEVGVDFVEVIREAVVSCEVLVALIGRQWATIADKKGRRRLDNPDDYVRFELQTALDYSRRVIPVLVDGAEPPQPEQLPPGLQKLARLNAFELHSHGNQVDVGPLLVLINDIVNKEDLKHNQNDWILGNAKATMSEPYEPIEFRTEEKHRVISRLSRLFRDTK